MYSVLISDIVKTFELEVIYASDDMATRSVTKSEVNRPALQLAGFFSHFDSDRIQVIGKVEHAYLSRLDNDFREEVLSKIFAFNIPCLVICNGHDIFPEMLVFANEYNVPIFRTKLSTSDLMGEIIKWLKVELAQRITLHGVLVDIYGTGILITGDSGVGKSETALELVKRGHRLVADDAVEIKRVSHSTLVGRSPALIQNFIELRGIGIIDVKELFGVGSIKLTQAIDLVLNLEIWDADKEYDRLGLNEETTEILGNIVPKNTIPIRPGRNLAVICEAAAINFRMKKLGYNAAEVLTERLNRESF